MMLLGLLVLCGAALFVVDSSLASYQAANPHYLQPGAETLPTLGLLPGDLQAERLLFTPQPTPSAKAMAADERGGSVAPGEPQEPVLQDAATPEAALQDTAGQDVAPQEPGVLLDPAQGATPGAETSPGVIIAQGQATGTSATTGAPASAGTSASAGTPAIAGAFTEQPAIGSPTPAGSEATISTGSQDPGSQPSPNPSASPTPYFPIPSPSPTPYFPSPEAPAEPAPAADPTRASYTPSQPVVRLLIPRLKIKRAVVDIGLTANQQWNTDRLFANQNRPDLVGHLLGSALPGESSNIVLVGHNYDYNAAGVFVNLNKLKAGDRITLVTEDGQEHVYEVAKVKVVPYSGTGNGLDRHLRFMGPTPSETLTLVTCGGANIGFFNKRVYVVAYPVQ